MKKFTLALWLTFASIACLAQTSDNQRYSLSLQGIVGHNTTWGHYGGAHIHAYMPVVKNVDIMADVELLGSNVYNVGLTFRPKFALPVGEIFVDATAYASAIARNQLVDIVGAMSLGYQMDYISLQVGWFYRAISSTHRSWDSEESYVCEPFNLSYRLQINTRPQRERWNIYLGAGNFTQTQYERMWQPLFFLGGYYDIRPQQLLDTSLAAHFRLLAELQCKPSGIFHMNASLYGLQGKLGFAYTF